VQQLAAGCTLTTSIVVGVSRRLHTDSQRPFSVQFSSLATRNKPSSQQQRPKPIGLRTTVSPSLLLSRGPLALGSLLTLELSSCRVAALIVFGCVAFLIDLLDCEQVQTTICATSIQFSRPRPGSGSSKRSCASSVCAEKASPASVKAVASTKETGLPLREQAGSQKKYNISPELLGFLFRL
jgi:hypothetical protein